MIKVEDVPFDTAKEPVTNAPALVVVLAIAVRFWVLVSSEVNAADVR